MFAITAFIYIFTKYYDIDRVKDIGEIKAELPSLISLDGLSPSKLKYDFEHLLKILPFSAAMAFTGLLESLIMVRDAEAALGGPGAPAVHAAAAQPGLCLEACHVGTVAGYGRCYGRAALP